MKVQSTNFTEVPLLLRERKVERKYNDEEDANFNHVLRNARPGCLRQKLRMC